MESPQERKIKQLQAKADDISYKINRAEPKSSDVVRFRKDLERVHKDIEKARKDAERRKKMKREWRSPVRQSATEHIVSQVNEVIVKAIFEGGKLIGSDATLDGLKSTIEKRWLWQNVSFKPTGDKQWDVYIGDNKADEVRVVQRGGRFRFEKVEEDKASDDLETMVKKFLIRFESHLYYTSDVEFQKFVRSLGALSEIQRTALNIAREQAKEETDAEKSEAKDDDLNIDIDDIIKLSKKDLDKENIDYLEKAFWQFYPNEITWNEIPDEPREALQKIGKFLVRHGKLKDVYLKEEPFAYQGKDLPMPIDKSAETFENIISSLKDIETVIEEQGVSDSAISKAMKIVANDKGTDKVTLAKAPSLIKQLAMSLQVYKDRGEFDGSMKSAKECLRSARYTESEEDIEASDDDAYLTHTGPLGVKTSASISGKHLGNFSSDEEAEEAVVEYMLKHNFYPNAWYVSDHGNIEPYEFSKESKRKLGYSASEAKELNAKLSSIIGSLTEENAPGTSAAARSMSDTALFLKKDIEKAKLHGKTFCKAFPELEKEIDMAIDSKDIDKLLSVIRKLDDLSTQH